jgi:UDP-hydrolysing UDP-N-acetyl-D-glucosamine 2-epimerase
MNVTAVIVDRANYGRMKSLLVEMQAEESINLSVICCGSTLLKRFHQPVTEIARSFNVTHRIYHEVEGDKGVCVVNSMALLMPQLAVAFQQNDPDFVLIIGDRFETLAVATTAAMLKLCIIHVQGGEHSGNIDNVIRHTITKLAHYHLPATHMASVALQRMGENPSTFLGIGCPSVDLVKYVVKDYSLSNTILCVYHPEDCIENSAIVDYLLFTLERLKLPVLMMWPNIDEGSEEVTKTIRRYIDKNNPTWLNMLVNVPPVGYDNILASVKGCVGNSSSFVRDSSFFGTPCVVIGDRQVGRIKTENVLRVCGCDLDTLFDKMNYHFEKRFQASEFYGVDGVAKRFVEKLKGVKSHRLKRNNLCLL